MKRNGSRKQKKSVRERRLTLWRITRRGFVYKALWKEVQTVHWMVDWDIACYFFLFLSIEMFHGFLKPQCLFVCGARGGVWCLPPFRQRGDCAGCALGVRHIYCAFQCNRFAFLRTSAVPFTSRSFHMLAWVAPKLTCLKLCFFCVGSLRLGLNWGMCVPSQGSSAQTEFQEENGRL